MTTNWFDYEKCMVKTCGHIWLKFESPHRCPKCCTPIEEGLIQEVVSAETSRATLQQLGLR